MSDGQVYAAPKPRARVKAPKPAMERKSRLGPNHERRAEAFERDFGAKSEWVRDSLACVVSGSEGSRNDPIVVAHVRSRGAGGDSRDIVPMLASLHQELHDIGQESFQRKHRKDLAAAADLVEDKWQRFIKGSEG